MKINNNYDIQNKYLESYRQKQEEEKKVKIEKQGKDVEVEISETTKKLVNELNKSKEGQFSERVEEIRKSVLEGTYKVSTDQIADKIMTAIEKQRESED